MAALGSKTWLPRCAEVTVGRNGLTVAFACLPDLQVALGKFCGPATNTPARLEAKGSRVFTLLPSRGSFGLFSALPVNPGHFRRGGTTTTIKVISLPGHRVRLPSSVFRAKFLV